MFMPLIFLLMGGTIVAVLWIGGNYVRGVCSPATSSPFFTYVSEILMSLMMVSMVMMMLTRSIACGKRVMAVLNGAADHRRKGPGGADRGERLHRL